MRLFLEHIKKSFQNMMIYRMAIVLGWLYPFFTIFISITVWKALYSSATEIAGVTLQNMLTYTAISTLVLQITDSKLSSLVAGRLNSGDISLDLAKPIGFKPNMVAQAYGEQVSRIILFSFTPVILASALYQIDFSISFGRLLLFIIGILFGIVLRLELDYVLGLLCFWFKTDFYTNWMMGAFMTLFAGSAVPIWFYPKWLATVSRYLPFRYFAFEPISIYFDIMNISSVMRIYLIQIIWIITLFFVERLLWSKAQKKIIVFGG